MQRIFTKKKEQRKRSLLRNNMTKAETFLWIELKNKKLLGQRFLRQFSIGAFVVDFYCPILKLAIEVDGATHLTDEEIEYDKIRQYEIEKFKIKFLRFTNIQIYEDMFNVLEIIRKEVEGLCKSNPHLELF